MKRIFVVGRHRSGTTWVTNILEAHPDIFVPSHPEHHGQHESAFFSSLFPYCNWGAESADRWAIYALFFLSDYGKLLAIDSDKAQEFIGYHPSLFFQEVMDTAAHIREKKAWAEKTPAHTLYLEELVKWFPDGIFIAVDRNPYDTTISNVYKFSYNKSIINYILQAARTILYKKIIYSMKNRVHIVSYEKLLRDYNMECERMFRAIGMLPENVTQSRFAKDSSFKKERPEVSKLSSLAVNATAFLLSLLPGFLFIIAARIYKRRKRVKLPVWFFKLHEKQ